MRLLAWRSPHKGQDMDVISLLMDRYSALWTNKSQSPKFILHKRIFLVFINPKVFNCYQQRKWPIPIIFKSCYPHVDTKTKVILNSFWRKHSNLRTDGQSINMNSLFHLEKCTKKTLIYESKRKKICKIQWRYEIFDWE